MSGRPSDAAIAAAFWEHRARENSLPFDLGDAKLIQFGNDIVGRARVLEPSIAGGVVLVPAGLIDAATEALAMLDTYAFDYGILPSQLEHKDWLRDLLDAYAKPHGQEVDGG